MRPLYAIRHKPTGYFLPECPGQNGYSYVEPVDCSGDFINPRLVPTRRGAECILTQWLRGHHTPIHEYEDDGYGRTYRFCAGTEIEHQPNRIRSDMEIVEFKLIEGTK